MAASALTFRAQQDRQRASEVAKSVEDGVAKTHEAAERIRRVSRMLDHMNEIYRERLDGKRRRNDDH